LACKTIPARRQRPPATWTRRYLNPAPRALLGRDGEHLPEEEEGEKIPGEDHPQGASCVNEGRRVLEVIFDVKGVKDGDETDEVEDVSKDQGEPVDPAEDEIEPDKPDDPVVPLRH
jgi:hypothetical protein